MSKASSYADRQSAIKAAMKNPVPAIRNTIAPIQRAAVIPQPVVVAPSPAPVPVVEPVVIPPLVEPITRYVVTCSLSEYTVGVVNWNPKTWLVTCTEDTSAGSWSDDYEAPAPQVIEAYSHLEALVASGIPLGNIKEVTRS